MTELFGGRQPRSPHSREISATALMSAEKTPINAMSPAIHMRPPINAPETRPMPAAAKKPDIIVARTAGTSSVLKHRAVTAVNSKVRKTMNRAIKAIGNVCAR